MRPLVLALSGCWLCACLDFGGAVDELCDAGHWQECAQAIDAGGVDAGGVDAGGVDAGGVDAGGGDAGDGDAGGLDAGPSDAGALDAGVFDAGGCIGASRGPWCWEAPQSTGNELDALWSTGGAIRVAGSGGLMLEWTGAKWVDRTELLPSPSLPTPLPFFHGAVTSRDGQLYLYGEHTRVLKWDGARFVDPLYAGGDFIAASAASARTVFLPAATSATPTVLLSVPTDGGSAQSITVSALSGQAPTDLYVDDTSCLVALRSPARVLECFDGGVTPLTFADGGAPWVFRFIQRADGGLSLGASSGTLFERTGPNAWVPRRFAGAQNENDLVAGAPYAGQTRVVGQNGQVIDFEQGAELELTYAEAFKTAFVNERGVFWAVGAGGSVISAEQNTVTHHEGISARNQVRGLSVDGGLAVAAMYAHGALQRRGPGDWTNLATLSLNWASTWTDGASTYFLSEDGELHQQDVSAPLFTLAAGQAAHSVTKVAQLRARGEVLWGAAGAIVFRYELSDGGLKQYRLDSGVDYVSDLELISGGVVVTANQLLNGYQPTKGTLTFIPETVDGSTQKLSRSNALMGVSVTPDGGLWVAGDGVLGRVEGGAYLPEGVNMLANRNFVDLFTAPDGTLWALEATGTVLHRGEQGSWSEEYPPWGAGENFQVSILAGDGSSLWLAGNDGSILRRPLP